MTSAARPRRQRGSQLLAVWRPGQRRLAVKRFRLPARDAGSDSLLRCRRQGSAQAFRPAGEDATQEHPAPRPPLPAGLEPRLPTFDDLLELAPLPRPLGPSLLEAAPLLRRPVLLRARMPGRIRAAVAADVAPSRVPPA